MKTIAQILAVATFPFCGSFFLQAQDAPLPPPPALTPPQPPPRALRGPSTVPAPQVPSVNAGGGAGGMMGGGTTFADRLQRIIKQASTTPAPGPGSGRLIVRSSAMDPKLQAGLEEDLAIMAHILSKAVDGMGGTRPAVAMGIDVFGGPGPAGVRALYLEGYGVLFTLNTGMRLVEAPSNPEQKKEESAADSTWEEAKHELYGQGPNAPAPGAPFEAYSAEKVTKFADSLVEVLKNAANIRGLKPEDYVTVCVMGAPVAPVQGGGAMGGSAGGVTWGAMGSAPGAPQNTSLMTIRAKKSQIDSFAKGNTGLEDFRKQVEVRRYQDAASAVPPAGFGGFGGGMGGFGGGGKF